MHTWPSLNSADAQIKVYDHVKCLIKLSKTPSINQSNAQELLYEALGIIEKTMLNYFKREHIARLMVTKGIILSKLDKFVITILICYPGILKKELKYLE